MWDIQSLFRRHGKDIERFLRRRGASSDMAEDITQETFLRVLTAAPAMPIGNDRAYLFGVARNLSVDIARRQRLFPTVADAEMVLAALPDEAPSAERVAISRQELAILQAALDEVPQTPREVFLLRVEGHTFAAIGEKLDIPLQTAFSQMVKVMMHLKSRLDQTQGDEPPVSEKRRR